jgi:hypothetical protein
VPPPTPTRRRDGWLRFPCYDASVETGQRQARTEREDRAGLVRLAVRDMLGELPEGSDEALFRDKDKIAARLHLNSEANSGAVRTYVPDRPAPRPRALPPSHRASSSLDGRRRSPRAAEPCRWGTPCSASISTRSAWVVVACHAPKNTQEAD